MVKPENSLYLHRFTNRIKVAVETIIALLIRHKKGCWAKLFVHNGGRDPAQQKRGLPGCSSL